MLTDNIENSNYDKEPLSFLKNFEGKQVLSMINDARNLHKDFMDIEVKINYDGRGGFDIDKEGVAKEVEKLDKTGDESRMSNYHSMIKDMTNLLERADLIDKKHDGATMTISELLDLAEKSALVKVEKDKSPENFSVN